MKTYFRFLTISVIFFGSWNFLSLSSRSVTLSREILEFGNSKKLTKKCLKEIQNLISTSRKVQKLRKCQSFPQPTGDFDRALRHLSINTESDCLSTQTVVKPWPRNHFTYLKSRESDPPLRWLYDRLQTIEKKFKQMQTTESVKNGIIYLGLLDPAIQNGIRQGIGRGGPLGELIQWADVIAALDSINQIGFRIVISIKELGLIKGKTCYEETEFPSVDFLVTDITGAKVGFSSNRLKTSKNID